MAGSIAENQLEWWTLVDGLRAGDHVLFWRDASRTSLAVLEDFLRGARARNDLAAVFLSEADWHRLAERLREDRVSVDRLQAQGHLILISPTTLLTDADRSAEQVAEVLEELAASARKKGYSALSLVGSIAGPAFVRGEQAVAEAIEAAVHARRGQARTLCLYDSLDLYPLRVRDAYELIRFHTHTLTALGPGQLHAEPVEGGRKPAVKGVAASRSTATADA